MVQSVKPYLFKSLRNHLIDSLELQRSNLTLSEETIELLDVKYSQEDFIINEIVSKEIRQQVIEVINKLTPRQREAIYLRYFQDQEFENIAQIMGMNIQSVRNTLQRGMQLMRELMLIEPFLIMISISLWMHS